MTAVPIDRATGARACARARAGSSEDWGRDTGTGHGWRVRGEWSGVEGQAQGQDRADKLPIYAEHGVQYASLVDPSAQLLEVYRLEAARWLQLGTWRGDARVRAEPFDAIELTLDGLWKP